MTTRADLTFDLGEDWVISITCNMADGVTVLDLTGAAIALVVGTFAAPVLTSTGSISAPTAGRALFRVSPAQQSSAPIAAGVYQYTIRATLSDGTLSDQAYGVLKIRGA